MARNYFEQDPWNQAISCLNNQNLGEVAEISIHCTSKQSEFIKTEEKWKKRVSTVLGAPLRSDELRNAEAFSFLARYGNNAIVRMFIDKSETGICENFEIVTKNALLVWKPDVRPQGRISYTGDEFCDLVQPYSIELKGK
jgi:hypothetical protein